MKKPRGITARTIAVLLLAGLPGHLFPQTTKEIFVQEVLSKVKEQEEIIDSCIVNVFHDSAGIATRSCYVPVYSTYVIEHKQRLKTFFTREERRLLRTKPRVFSTELYLERIKNRFFEVFSPRSVAVDYLLKFSSDGAMERYAVRIRAVGHDDQWFTGAEAPLLKDLAAILRQHPGAVAFYLGGDVKYLFLIEDGRLLCWVLDWKSGYVAAEADKLIESLDYLSMLNMLRSKPLATYWTQ